MRTKFFYNIRYKFNTVSGLHADESCQIISAFTESVVSKGVTTDLNHFKIKNGSENSLELIQTTQQ